MKSSTTLRVFITLFLLWPCLKDAKAQSNCEEIKVEVQVSHTTDGQSNGKIKLILGADHSIFKIHLFESGSVYKLNLNKRDIENLKKGTYLLVITDRKEDSRFCPRNVEVIIK